MSSDRHLLRPWTPLIAGTVVVAAAVGVFVVWREAGRDREPSDLARPFVYDVDRYRTIPDEQIGYREVARIEVPVERATCIAVGPRDEIVVGGDRTLFVFAPDGTRRHTIPTDDTPLALAFSRDGNLYVALRRAVLSGAIPGPLTTLLEIPGEDARITSLAVDGRGIYVADAGTRGVWRFSLDGLFEARIGDRDPDRDIPGFVVPSPYFDLLVAPDGLLRVVDPGRHQITAFTTDGDLELRWGRASFALDGFSGCCNPSHLAMLPDGRFVTSEKGIPRVKVYDADGRFVTAVVGADGLSTETEPCDVATESTGCVLLLDPGSSVIRRFEPTGRTPRDDD